MMMACAIRMGKDEGGYLSPSNRFPFSPLPASIMVLCGQRMDNTKQSLSDMITKRAYAKASQQRDKRTAKGDKLYSEQGKVMVLSAEGSGPFLAQTEEFDAKIGSEGIEIGIHGSLQSFAHGLRREHNQLPRMNGQLHEGNLTMGDSKTSRHGRQGRPQLCKNPSKGGSSKVLTGCHLGLSMTSRWL